MKDKIPGYNAMLGIEFIAAERQRQIEEEGWSIQRDCEEHRNNELVIAAMCYACPDVDKKHSGPLAFFKGADCPAMWPWNKEWWKPSSNNRIRELTKAGALIAAEIDRLLAAEATFTDPEKHYAFVDRKCPRCDGGGEIGGFEGFQICPECNGTGHIGSFEEVPPIDPAKIQSALAYRLRKTREQRKIGMSELAAHFGWSVVHLSDIERGRVEPTPEEREQIKNWVYPGE